MGADTSALLPMLGLMRITRREWALAKSDVIGRTVCTVRSAGRAGKQHRLFARKGSIECMHAPNSTCAHPGIGGSIETFTAQLSQVSIHSIGIMVCIHK